MLRDEMKAAPVVGRARGGRDHRAALWNWEILGLRLRGSLGARCSESSARCRGTRQKCWRSTLKPPMRLWPALLTWGPVPKQTPNIHRVRNQEGKDLPSRFPTLP